MSRPGWPSSTRPGRWCRCSTSSGWSASSCSRIRSSARRLDWEDFDLLRDAGTSRRATSPKRQPGGAGRRPALRRVQPPHRLRHARHQESRQPAGLLARNAERHADKPEFRADMLVTLHSSVEEAERPARPARRGYGGEAEPLRADRAAAQVVAAVAEVKTRVASGRRVRGGRTSRRSPIRSGSSRRSPISSRTRSTPARPARRSGSACGRDGGRGARSRWSIAAPACRAEFVRTRLFKPFASTKDGGFGIGAFEARELVAAMGGRLEVESAKAWAPASPSAFRWRQTDQRQPRDRSEVRMMRRRQSPSC